MSTPTTITICPPWCSVKHDVSDAPCIVVGGAGISPAQAIALASSLTTAAEVLTDGEATR